MSSVIKTLAAAAGSGGGPVYTSAGAGTFDMRIFSMRDDGGSGDFSDTDLSMTGLTGYNGVVDILATGTVSNSGAFWNNQSDITHTGYGEQVFWKYQALGDEVSYQVRQMNFNSATFQTGGSISNYTSSARAYVGINGGANNTKLAWFGSGAGNNTVYGHGGAAVNVSGFADSVFVRQNYGASRQNTIAYYNDGTSYGPAGYAEYGDSYTTTHTWGGQYIAYAKYRTYNGGTYQLRVYNGSTWLEYSVGSYASSYSWSRNPTNGYGAVVFVFRNDH